MDPLRRRLATARLYLVCDAISGAALDGALTGGVDIVQLRMKDAPDERILAAAARFRERCSAHGALFIVNDRPDLAVAAGADGAHIGQDDMPPAAARALLGPERLLGRSTHTPAQVDAAAADPEVDYTGVGPVHATPTKPGRPAVGLALVAYAAGAAPRPWFAIGGIDAANVAAVAAAGAGRVAVVRAITAATDPRTAAAELRAVLTARVTVAAA